MDIWGWLIGYVVLFALLHLILFFVYSRGEDDDRSPLSRRDGPNSPSSGGTNRDRQSTSHRPDPTPAFHPNSGVDGVETSEFDERFDYDAQSVRCPYCGVTNEMHQTVTYCWNCVSTLQ